MQEKTGKNKITSTTNVERIDIGVDLINFACRHSTHSVHSKPNFCRQLCNQQILMKSNNNNSNRKWSVIAFLFRQVVAKKSRWNCFENSSRNSGNTTSLSMNVRHRHNDEHILFRFTIAIILYVFTVFFLFHFYSIVRLFATQHSSQYNFFVVSRQLSVKYVCECVCKHFHRWDCRFCFGRLHFFSRSLRSCSCIA